MNREEYTTAAMKLNAQSPKDDLPTQKFKRGSKVFVTNKTNSNLNMDHFETDFYGIVQYTYAQKFGGDDIDNYSVIVLDNNNKPINSISWYLEYQLTLIDNNINKGLKIIEEYRNIKW